MIRLLTRDEIHDKKWNGCIHFGHNGLPYAYTWYLDNIAEFWEGIVLNDYDAVFPLVWNKKFGVYYLYQPLFAQQLGIFSLDPLSKNQIQSFYSHIPEKFKFIEININGFNEYEEQGYQYFQRDNYLLDLSQTYEQIEKGYSGNVKRNLKRASRNNLKLVMNIKPEKFVDFFEEHTAPMIKEYKPQHHHALLRLIYHSIQYNVGFVNAVSTQDDQMLAMGFFLHHPKFVINLLPSSSKEGKNAGAMSYLYDYLIRVNCEKPRVFDFEGSMIESIARFYKGFGATPVKYWRLKRNNLPWYLRLIKK